MRTPVRLGAYAAGLVAVFVAAWGLGVVSGPPPGPTGTAHEAGGTHGGGTDHVDADRSGAAVEPAIPGGLQVARPLPAATGPATTDREQRR